MVTIRDVAKAAGVSVATASRALNGLSNVTPETRAKIEKAALWLDYVPHSGARSLTRQRTDAIGVILPDLYGEFFSELVRGIDRVVHAAGKQMLLGTMHGSPHETVQAMRAMRGRVDGLLVMPPNSDARSLAGSALRGLPTVLLNAGDEQTELPFVAVDNYAGARMITEHLIERGARAIVHLAGPTGNRDAEERIRGFRDSMLEQLGISDPLILPGDFREDSARSAAFMLLESGVSPEAIFAGNDLSAIELMTALRERGRVPGRDLMVAGFDDIPLACYVTPKLTTVRTEIADLGATAAQMVLRLLDGEDSDQVGQSVIKPKLAVRGSTESFVKVPQD